MPSAPVQLETQQRQGNSLPIVSTSPVNMFALDAKIGLLDVPLDQRAAEVECPGVARFGEIVGKRNECTKSVSTAASGFFLLFSLSFLRVK
jgi:hypothetical protein